MAKLNFSKVEQAFSAGLLQITVANLLQLADLAASIGATSTGDIYKDKRFQKKLSHFLFPDPRRLLIILFRHDVEWLHKKDRNFFKRINVDQDKILKILSDPDKVSEEQFELIRKIKKRIDIYKKKIEEKRPNDYLEQLVESERKRHINKRFNISERWLPLS